jgi:hypothetical protein
MPIIIQIIRQICNGKQVFLFGHSYGGLIVNRICEEITKCMKDPEYMKGITGKYTDITKQRLLNNIENLTAASFGSIYIPERSKLGLINILN